MGRKYGFRSGIITCQDLKAKGDVYIQDDLIFSDVSAGVLGVTGGIDMSATTSAYGLDLNGATISAADFRLKNGTLISNNSATVLTITETTTAFVGAITVSTTFTATGLSTLTGGATIGGALIQGGTGAITSTSGAGAIAVTGQIHEVTTTGTGDAITLANGTAGQRLTVLYVAEGAGGDTAVITPTTLAGGSTITLNNLGDSADLQYSSTGGWYVLGLGGAAAVA